nr:Surfeit locus 6 [Hymenolepis microstoma]
MGIFVGKTTPKVLDKAIDFENKVSKLKSEKPDKAAELNLKKAWQLAALKAQGVKVKTDISKIKKTTKKLEKRKQQSAKRWQERQKLVKLEHSLKQRKRQRNIDNRRVSKRSKKYKRLVKRGHILPELPKD